MFLPPETNPAAHGAGVLSTGLGWKVVFAIYVGHALYAANLATFYNPVKPGKSRTTALTAVIGLVKVCRHGDS